MIWTCLPESYLVRLSLPLPPSDKLLLRLLSWVSVLMILALLLGPIAQNFRYLTPSYGAICLLAGFGVGAVMLLARRWAPAVPAPAIITGLIAAGVWIAATDYERFERAFVMQEVPDLSIKMVRTSLR